jgi:hypothetical protein
MVPDAGRLIGLCHCGETSWLLDGDPGRITACNCTLCSRYGALWAYDFEDERIRLEGGTNTYTRAAKANPTLEIHFCPNCACVLAYRELQRDGDGRRRIAVNIRLAPPDSVAHLAIDHFDGRDNFEDMPPDGRCVRDLWA